MKKHIVFDCDCTFGVENCDVDDGLALMYLLGCPDAEIAGITASYGNSRLPVVLNSLERLLTDLGRNDIPVKPGGEKAGEYVSEASDFLTEMADRYPGELSVLATGSLTNLMGAWRKDPSFFGKVKEIVLMGGITEPLVFRKKIMDELNFSCDPAASLAVLTQGTSVSVITGNNCLKVLFTKDDYKKRLFSTENAAAVYIREKTDYWFGYNENDYGIGGFYNWDVTAAVYLMYPELFSDDKKGFCLSEKDLKTGYLRAMEKDGSCREKSGEVSILNLPVIGDEKAFKDNIYHAWLQVKMGEKKK